VLPDLAGVQKRLLGHEFYSRKKTKIGHVLSLKNPQKMNHCRLYPNTRSFKTCHRLTNFLRNIQPDMTIFGYVSSSL
jgi:hypothetical protein